MLSKETYFNNKQSFKKQLQDMIDDFILENKVVSVGDRVNSDEMEFEIVKINFKMTATGSASPYLPMLDYLGKPVNKKDKVIRRRIPVLMWHFSLPNGDEYRREHVCYEGNKAGYYMRR